MAALGMILFMLGASGITDMHGNLQGIPVAMVFTGMVLLWFGWKRSEKRR